MGTGFWRAPEILRLTKDKSIKPDLKAADVYSFAMTCYEVLTGKKPFQDELFTGLLKSNEYDKVIEGLRPKLHVNLDDHLTTLIKSCWAPDPECRPNFERICERLLCVRATQLSRNDVTRSFLKWVPQFFGAWTSARPAGVRSKDQSSSQDDESSSELDLENIQSDENDQTLIFAELNDHLKFLNIIKHNDLKMQRLLGEGLPEYMRQPG